MRIQKLKVESEKEERNEAEEYETEVEKEYLRGREKVREDSVHVGK